MIEDEAARVQYVSERAENAGIGEALGAVTREPLLAGQQNNLYLPFITGAWRRAIPTGAVALVHPDGFLSDPKAAKLRATAYRRYREYYTFINQLQLFAEINHTRPFGVHVYGAEGRSVGFKQAAFLYHPAVVDLSIRHDGSGDLPGCKLETGEWDIRPHRDRLVHVTSETLSAWAALLAYPEPDSTPVVRTVTSAEGHVVEALARHPLRLAEMDLNWSPGWHEMTAPREGIIEWRTERKPTLAESILQGPHIGVATPFSKEPREVCNSRQDYDRIDVSQLPERWVPRTNWQRAIGEKEFWSRLPIWDGRSSAEAWRVAFRKMLPFDTSRSLFAALIPPGPSVSGSLSVAGLGEERLTVLLAGVAASLPLDYFVRVIGMANLEVDLARRFPMVREDGPLVHPILHRTLRLNCLTRDYAALWESLFTDEWRRDTIAAKSTQALAPATPEWSLDVVARSEEARWHLLLELDVLVALAFGMTADGLEALYRAQFPVLQSYDRQLVFDGRGRALSGTHHNHGALQAALERDASAKKLPGWVKIWPRVQAFLAGDTGVDLGPFVPPFRPANRGAAMTQAYWTFIDRYDLAPPAGAERQAA